MTATYKWITNRPPTEEDVDVQDCIFVPEYRPSIKGQAQAVTLHDYLSIFKEGHPWCRTKRARKHVHSDETQIKLIQEETCATCRFYRNGECRRRAPVEGWGGAWPQPMNNDWCGEWEARQ